MKDNTEAGIARGNVSYRTHYRNTLLITLALVISNLVLVMVVYYLAFTKPDPIYFSANPEGETSRMVPLVEPIVSQRELLEWASGAVTQAFTFDFTRYQQQFANTSQLFTEVGWSNFIAEIERTKTLQTVVGDKLSATAVLTGAPVIIKQGILGGRYTWAISMPVLVNYERLNIQRTRQLVVTINVRRVDTRDTPRGIAIQSFNVADLSRN